jgi:hypothetical protein
MALIEHALAAAIGNDRRGEPLGKCAHLSGCVIGTAADEDDRMLGLGEQRGGARDRIIVERWLRLGRELHRQIDLGLGGEHIRRHLDPNRPRPPGLQQLEGSADHSRRHLRAGHAVGPLGERAQDADLVRDLVQQAMALVDRAAWDLPDQCQHLRTGRIGRGQRRRAVEEARAWLAGCERGTERHIGGALLVPRMHDRQRVAGVEHGVEQMIALHAGQAIDCRHALSED